MTCCSKHASTFNNIMAHCMASIRPSLLLELLLLALAELPLETGVLLGGLGHATHLVNAAQQEAALPAITIRNENSRRLSLITSARPNELLRPLLHPLVCKFTQPSLQSLLQCTGSLSHLRTMLPKSSSRPLPPQKPNHTT